MHKKLTEKSEVSLLKSNKGKQHKIAKPVEESTSVGLKPGGKMKLKKEEAESSKRKKCC